MNFVNLFSVPISITSKPQALALVGEWLREYRSVISSRLSVIGYKSAGFQSIGSKPANRKQINQKLKTENTRLPARQGRPITGFPKIITTPNPEIIVAAQSDPEFLKALQGADLSIPDGVGIVWAVKLLGSRFSVLGSRLQVNQFSVSRSQTDQPKTGKPETENRKPKTDNRPPSRVSGLDLMESLIGESAQHGWKVIFLGGRPGIAAKAAATLQRAFNIQNSAFRIESLSGPQNISAISKSENNRLIAQINSFQPDLLFVAFGHGKQEKWLTENRERLTAGVAIGVGGAFDQIAAPSLRPPPYINSIGLGWLYRLLRQPWRVKRQLALLKFVGMVLGKKLQSSSSKLQ